VSIPVDPTSTDDTGGRLDPRAARSQQRAITSALDLIREVGVGRTSMEAIAARSGVAKTTLYRQFDDLETLLFAAFESLKREQTIPVEHGVVVDVERWLQQFAVALYSDEFSPLIPAMIEVAERTDRGRELAVQFALRRRQSMQLRLQHAVEDGELPPDVDVDTVVSLLMGPLFYRRFVSRQQAPAAFISQTVASGLGSTAKPST
jgi:AcrR family transcriptional regulator